MYYNFSGSGSSYFPDLNLDPNCYKNPWIRIHFPADATDPYQLPRNNGSGSTVLDVTDPDSLIWKQWFQIHCPWYNGSVTTALDATRRIRIHSLHATDPDPLPLIQRIRIQSLGCNGSGFTEAIEAIDPDPQPLMQRIRIHCRIHCPWYDGSGSTPFMQRIRIHCPRYNGSESKAHDVYWWNPTNE